MLKVMKEDQSKGVDVENKVNRELKDTDVLWFNTRGLSIRQLN